MSSIEYSLRWLVWSKTKDGQNNRRRPKPVTQPGTTGHGRRTLIAKHDTHGMSKRQLRDYLARPRTRPT